jgi:WD40 repeat protein
VANFLEIRKHKKAHHFKTYQMMSAKGINVSSFVNGVDYLPIQDIVFDDVSNVLITASGYNRKTILGSKNTRGMLKVYSIQKMESEIFNNYSPNNNADSFSSVTGSPITPAELVAPTRTKPPLETAYQFSVPMAFHLEVKEEYTESITHLAWDRTRRLLLVGMINGIILYYHLSEDLQELTYCGEFDYHEDPLVGLQIDPDNADYYFAVSQKGRVTMYDLNEAKLITHLEKGNDFQVTCFTFAWNTKVAYLGTNKGSIICCDCELKPVKVLHTIQFPGVPGLLPKINHLHYCAERRSVIVNTSNNQVYFMEINSSDFKDAEFKLVLSLNRNSSIIYSTLFHHNQYFLAITNTENLLIFEYKVPSSMTTFKPSSMVEMYKNKSNKPVTLGKNTTPATTPTSGTSAVNSPGPTSPVVADARPVNSNIGTTAASRHGAQYDFLSSTASEVMPWFEVIHEDNQTIMDWLRAKGVQYDPLTATTAELRNLVAKTENVSQKDYFNASRKKTISESPFFAQQVSHARTRLGLHFPSPFIQSHCLVAEKQLLFFGGADGYLYLSSMREFFPSYEGVDKKAIQEKRKQLFNAFVNPSSAAALTTAEAIQAPKKTTRGKRLVVQPVGEQVEGDKF